MTGYFAELEHELLAAAARQRDADAPQPTHIRRRFRGRSLRVAAVLLALTVVAGVPAAAVTGVFRPHREPDGLVRLTERRVIAEGITSDHRSWKLLASRSDVGFCFGIELPGPVPGHDERTVSEGCGGALPGSLSPVATVGGGSIRVDGRTIYPHNGLALGMTPDQAVRVRVEARGKTVTVETVDDNAGLAGRFYVAELPIRTSLGPVAVAALNRNGTIIGKTANGGLSPHP